MTWPLGHVQSVLLAEICSQMAEKKNNIVYQNVYSMEKLNLSYKSQ